MQSNLFILRALFPISLSPILSILFRFLPFPFPFPLPFYSPPPNYISYVSLSSFIIPHPPAQTDSQSPHFHPRD